jgi:hypothetical protein
MQATEVDHIVPKVYGGTDDAANLRSLCGWHHRLKTATQDRRWGTHIGEPPSRHDAVGSVYARPGFPILGTPPEGAAGSAAWARQGVGVAP